MSERRRDNVSVVLEALQIGIPVKWYEFELFLSLDGQVGYSPGKDSPHLYNLDIPLNNFIKFCQDIPEEEITIMCCNIALNTKDDSWRLKKDE